MARPPNTAWKSLLLIASILLVVVACAGLLLEWEDAPQPLEAGPAPDPRAGRLYGVNFSLWRYSEGEMRAQLASIASLFPEGWVRVRIPWAEIEPAPGQFHWEKVDAFMQEAQAQSLRVLAVLETSPRWARRQGDEEALYAPPPDRRRFGAFVSAFAGRYAPYIDAYQIWDEPNIYPHWGESPVDARAYTALLREGAIQIREQDPTALVLAGGLAPNDEPSGRNQSDLTYLREMYAAGAAEWFDVLAAKAYGLRVEPDAPPQPASLNFQRLVLLREIMAEAGDAETPIWGVEFGWNSLPADWAGAPSPWGSVDAETQASWTRRAVEIAWLEWPWMEPLLWAEWQPAAPAEDPRWGFAALDANGTPLPIMETLRLLPARASIAGAGRHGFWEPVVKLEGGWRISTHGADIGGDGDAMTIRFAGTGLDLRIRPGDYWAYLTVEIDGAPADALPRNEAGHSYVVLYDPQGGEKWVTLAADLPPGEHMAHITAHGGWGQWALKEFMVRGRAPAGIFARWPLFAVCGGLGLAGLAWSLAGRRRGALRASLVEAYRRAAERWRGLPLGLRVGALYVAGAAFLLGPGPILPVIGLLAVMVLIVLWPAGGVVLATLAFPHFARPPVLLGRAVPNLELILWWTLLSLLWSEWAYHGTWRELLQRVWSTRSWLDAGVGLLLLAASLSTISASYWGPALYEWRVLFLGGSLLYFLWRALPAEGENWSWAAVDGLILGGLIAALAGIGQRVSGEGLITSEGVARVRAWYGSPNNLALYLDRIIPIALALGLFGRERLRRSLYLLGTLVMAGALYLTYSRGAWLLGLPAALLVLGLVRGGKWRGISLGLMVVTLAILIPLLDTPRFAGLLDFSSGSTFVRLKLWQGTWNMIRDHPWLGVGPDNFLYQYRSRYVLPSAWKELNLSHPHNIVLDAWTRVGLGGLVGLTVLLAGLFRRLCRAARREDGTLWPALAAGLCGSLAASLAHGLVDNSFFLVDLYMVLMMTAGLAFHLEEGTKLAGGTV